MASVSAWLPKPAVRSCSAVVFVVATNSPLKPDNSIIDVK